MVQVCHRYTSKKIFNVAVNPMQLSQKPSVPPRQTSEFRRSLRNQLKDFWPANSVLLYLSLLRTPLSFCVHSAEAFSPSPVRLQFHVPVRMSAAAIVK
uniref:Uncharacterized protein n=1 Tax=Ditylenchus dipsaci TaxID=166011 RepID=A0A915CMR1_9BILA